MLGKLFKHEFMDTAKWLVPMNLGLILLAFVGRFLLLIDQLGGISIIESFVISIYTLTIFALFILTAVYLTVRFYKTMYASQGYLTHTLPVSTISVLNVKILTSVFWMITAVLMTVFSLYVLGNSGDGFAAVYPGNAAEEFRSITGMYLWQFYLSLAAMVSAVCLSSALMICASLSVGQLFRQHRIVAAVGAYIVFYLLQQVISVVMLVFLGISELSQSAQLAQQIETAIPGGFLKELFVLVLLQAAVFGAVYYLLCYIITKNHLNLE